MKHPTKEELNRLQDSDKEIEKIKKTLGVPREKMVEKVKELIARVKQKNERIAELERELEDCG